MNKSRVILGGTLVGAVVGLIAAMLLTRRAEKNDRETAITAGEGFKLGVLLFGLLRAISSLSDD